MATKREADHDWPASAFLVVPDPEKPSVWKLRIKELVGGQPEVTQAQLGRAAAALGPGGFRGQQVDLTPEQRKAAMSKLRGLYRQHGWEPPGHLQDSKQEDLDNLTRLTEAVQADEAGKVWRVTLISPGWSENGKYYSRDVLATSTRLYEATKAFADHPSQQELRERPERSIRDVVGWYEGVKQEQDGRLIADLHLLESAGWLGAVLKERPGLLGLSHHALGRTKVGTAEGRTGRIVESIAKVVSVDVVTEAAAGGSIERMIASNREGDEEMDWENVTLEALQEARPDLVETILGQAKKETKGEAETALAELKEAVEKSKQENVQLRESVGRFEARAVITEKVATSNLPAPAQARVRQLLESNVPLKDGTLDVQTLETRITEAIQAEQDYLAQVGGSTVRGAGATGSTTDLQEALKKTESAMDKLFGIKTGGEK